MVQAANRYECTPPLCEPACACKALLVLPAKQFLIVTNKSIVLAFARVWRININSVSLARLSDNRFEVAGQEDSIDECFGNGFYVR
jgi:hypothetical protein